MKDKSQKPSTRAQAEGSKVKSFTLIELLVVIGILGILIGLLAASYSSVQMKSRDTKRKSDLKAIASALELYRQDKLPIAYPTDGSFLANRDYCWSAGGVASSCPAGNIYIKKIPVDPNSTLTTVDPYYYEVNNTDLTYTLCACLENATDPEGVAGNCAAVGYACSSGKKYVVNEP